LAREADLEDLRSRASLILEIPKVLEYPRDPKDEPYLNLAIAAEARYLVSFDNDLLDLMDDPDFRQRFPQLTILDPPAFLRALASS
jgi:predicted nucleic acid-binding protein